MLRRLYILIATFLSLTTSAQFSSKQPLNQLMEPALELEKPEYYRTAVPNEDGKFSVEVFFLSGNIKMRGTYLDRDLHLEDGFFQYFYKDGRIESQGNYITGQKTGTWQRFEADGSRKKDHYYPEEIKQISTSRHTPASFGGGYTNLIKYIKEKTNYPKEAIKKEIQGTVKVSFNVDEQGKIKDVSVIESAHFFLDRAAVKMIQNMPNWVPAKRKNTPVPSTFILPLNFSLETGEPVIIVGVGLE